MHPSVWNPTLAYTIIMGISAQQHRVCIGSFNSSVRNVNVNVGPSPNSLLQFLSQFCSSTGVIVSLLILYLYIIVYMIVVELGCSDSTNLPTKNKIIIRELPDLLNHLNLYFLTIVSSTVLKTFRSSKYDNLSDVFCIDTEKIGYLFSSVNKAQMKSLLSRTLICCLRWVVLLDCLVLFIFSMNKALVVLCNPSILNPGPKRLSVLYNNIQGFVNTRDVASDSPPLNMTKLHEIQGYIFTHKPDILILNETWLKKSILDKEILPDTYKVFRVDRSLKSHPWDPLRPNKFRKYGGGVLIAHKTDLDLSSVKFSKVSTQAEILSVQFKMASGRKFCISTFYRVGNLGAENFKEFEKHFVSLAIDKKMQKHILIGDFNLNTVSWPTGQTTCELQQKFIDFLTSDLGHCQLISESTHKAGNTLDLLFTNTPSIIQSINVFEQNEFCLSDHFGISFNIDMEVKHKVLPKRKTYNYRKANWIDMNNDLRHVNWDRVIDFSDPFVAWVRFKTILSQFCDRYIPKKTVRSQFQPPWYDSECDKIRRMKEKWRKRAKLSNTESDHEKFRSLRKKFKQVMNEKMRLNVEDDLDPALISKRFWSHVKSKSKSTRIPETVYYGTRVRNDTSGQSELFNEYFHDQFSEASRYDIDIDYSNNSFIDLRFHTHDVYLLLKGINSNKAAGPDGIHGIVLKNCASSLAYPLSILFNLSFSTGCIPQDWKTALVVPVHKKGDKGSVENYRPISLTSLVMKVFERCIKKSLYSACEDLLDPRQHGFINDRSCTTQMIPFTNDLALALNNKSKMDIIYFDFAKAFDSVSHDLILNKLKHQYNIDGLMLKFIKSYLEGRQQQVGVGGDKSSFIPVRSGVPQGSILGPLLFVLFINDIFSCISEGTNVALYADDTKIWRDILSSNDHHILQNDINMLFDWSITNRMNFHPRKCKVLTVTMQRSVPDSLPFSYELNRVIIDYVTSQMDLGVNMNTRLQWGPHCNDLVTKASSRLGLLRRTCHFTTNVKQKRALYLSLVRSIFEHCSILWSPQNSTQINKFAAIQKRAIKWIYGEQFASYSD